MEAKTKKVLWIIFWIVLGLILAAGIVWFFFFRVKIDWDSINSMISQQGAKYGDNAAQVEKILLAGCKDFANDSNKMKQAQDYATANKVSLEKVIFDSAVAAAKQLGYIE